MADTGWVPRLLAEWIKRTKTAPLQMEWKAETVEEQEVGCMDPAAGLAYQA